MFAIPLSCTKKEYPSSLHRERCWGGEKALPIDTSSSVFNQILGHHGLGWSRLFCFWLACGVQTFDLFLCARGIVVSSVQKHSRPKVSKN